MLAYRYRLYPTTLQAEALHRWCGCARAIYNAGLEQRQVVWRDHATSLSYNDQGANQLTEAKRALPWLAEPHSDVLQQSLRDLDCAYRNFFAGRAAFPRFKRKGQRDSFRVQNRKAGVIRVRRLNRRWGEIIIPKFGAVRFRWSRKPVGEIRHITVVRDVLGWHVCLCCEESESASSELHTGTPVGIDRGVTATAALSTDVLHCAPTLPPGQAERQRRLARKAGRQETARRHRPNDQRRRSRRHQDTLDALAKLKAREARLRKNFLHKLTTDIAKSHGVVVIEDLRVKSMARSAKGTIGSPGRNVAQKRGLNRAVLRQGWGEMEQMLAYKLDRSGGTLIKVNPAYTSQRCGHTAHADINAARNILAAGLAVTARGAFSEVSRGNEPRTTRRELANAA